MTSARAAIRGTLAFLVAAVVAIVLGVGAILGAAVVTASPPLFLGAGLVAFALVLYVGIRVATRAWSGDRVQSVRIGAFGTILVVVVAGFALTALRPKVDSPVPPAAVSGQRYWDLPTGSRIAYVELHATGTPRATPVVVLHGGPGVPDMAGDARYFRGLTQAGFDVYVYDQVGSGRSSRLQDPRQYTVQRNVRDLEAIRRTIGAAHIDLVAHSYGALIAAGYLAAHAEHVTRTVFVSPHPLDPSVKGVSVLSDLGNSQLRNLFWNLARPRALLAYGLVQVNPQAAHNYAGDAGMDARFDDVFRASESAQHCKGKPLGPKLHGLGFYANAYPQSATAPEHPDYRSALHKVTSPALVLKGSCDYLSWSSARAYLAALPHSQLVYIHNAGHDIYADQPAQSMGVIRSFLTGEALPIQPYQGSSAPGDYQGPK